MQDLLQTRPQNCTTFLNLKRSNPINKLIFWVKNIFKNQQRGQLMKELTKKQKHVLANKKYREKKQKEINKIIILNKLYLLIIILLSCLLIIKKLF